MPQCRLEERKWVTSLFTLFIFPCLKFQKLPVCLSACIQNSLCASAVVSNIVVINTPTKRITWLWRCVCLCNAAAQVWWWQLPHMHTHQRIPDTHPDKALTVWQPIKERDWIEEEAEDQELQHFSSSKVLVLLCSFSLISAWLSLSFVLCWDHMQMCLTGMLQ